MPAQAVPPVAQDPALGFRQPSLRGGDHAVSSRAGLRGQPTLGSDVS